MAMMQNLQFKFDKELFKEIEYKAITLNIEY